jgi:hypothetical protein
VARRVEARSWLMGRVRQRSMSRQRPSTEAERYGRLPRGPCRSEPRALVAFAVIRGAQFQLGYCALLEKDSSVTALADMPGQSSAVPC